MRASTRDPTITTTPKKSGSWRLRSSDAAPRDVVEQLRQGPDTLLAQGTVLKDGDRSTVVRLDAFGPPLLLKRYRLQGPWHTVVHALLPSRAASCWRNGHRLAAAGVPTPEPLVYGERRWGPIRLDSYLLTAFIEGPTLEALLEEQVDPSMLARIVDEFARTWQVLGELRVGHDDMKGSNFILDADGRVWMIDLDGMLIGLPGPLYRRARRAALDRFIRNWRDRPEVAASFRAGLGIA